MAKLFPHPKIFGHGGSTTHPAPKPNTSLRFLMGMFSWLFASSSDF
jgi:hypothetical protein